jgi:hypothetical protein
LGIRSIFLCIPFLRSGSSHAFLRKHIATAQERQAFSDRAEQDYATCTDEQKVVVDSVFADAEAIHRTGAQAVDKQRGHFYYLVSEAGGGKTRCTNIILDRIRSLPGGEQSHALGCTSDVRLHLLTSFF